MGGIYRVGQVIVPGWRGYRRRGKKGEERKEEVKRTKRRGKRKGFERRGIMRKGGTSACNSDNGALSMGVNQGVDMGTCPPPMFGGEEDTISNVPPPCFPPVNNVDA